MVSPVSVKKFQSKSHLKLAKGSQTLTIWFWNALDLGMTLTIQKWSFYVDSFKSYSPNKQTDRQTNKHTHTHTHTHTHMHTCCSTLTSVHWASQITSEKLAVLDCNHFIKSTMNWYPEASKEPFYCILWIVSKFTQLAANFTNETLFNIFKTHLW